MADYLDFSPWTNALAGYRKGLDEAYEGETARMIGSRLAANDIAGARAIAASRGNLESNLALAKFGQEQELFPYQKRKLTTETEAGEEALAERRKLRTDPLFSDGSAASSSTAKAPIASGGSSAAAPASGFPPSMLQTFGNSIRRHVLDPGIDPAEAQKEFRTLLAHPEFGQHLQKYGYVLNGQDWRGDAQRIVQDIERAAGGPMGPTVAQGQGQQAAAAPASPQADYADARAAVASGAPIPQNRLWIMQQKGERLLRTGDEKLMEAGKSLISLVETSIKGGIQLGPQGVEQIPGYRDASGKTLESEQQMRQDIERHPAVKTFEEIKSGYGRILEGYHATKPNTLEAKKGTGAGDIAMVYGYMKMLDPTSVVRESEYNTAESVGGKIPNFVVTTWNKLMTGERLPPDVRAQFMSMAKQLYDRAQSDADKVAGQYREIATRAGNNPANVVLDRTIAKPAVDPNAPQAPAYDPGKAAPAKNQARLPSVAPAQALDEARAAIRNGKDEQAVRRRLQQMGIDPGQL